MSEVVLGCDINDENDGVCRDTVADALEKAGNNVNRLPIHPTPFADYSYSSDATGKIGVYIMADSLVSVADLVYGNTNFKYAYFIIRGDLGRPRMSTREHFENNPIGRDPDCNYICDKLAGKSYGEMNGIIKDKAHIVFGTTPQEMADELIKAMGGEVSDSSSNSKSGTSLKDAIRELQSAWDGDVEIFVRGDEMHLRKIQVPYNPPLKVIEGKNVIDNALKITDYHPSTPNYLTGEWGDDKFIMKDDSLISRFGKIESTVEIPDFVETEEQLKSFMRREFYKLKRDNGHKVECTVIGDVQFQGGTWVRVYIPSYNLDDVMYISKASHDEERGKWETNLVLVDYPPSLGKPEDYKKGDEEDETETSETEDYTEDLNEN